MTAFVVKRLDFSRMPLYEVKDYDTPGSIYDRICGMFMGVFLGDALGAPHEFACNVNVIYTGKLEHTPFMNSRFHGRYELSVGQVTDDSEMTLALLNQLLEDKEFVVDNVKMAYIKWANSGGWMLGKNTRYMLKGYKTLKTHGKRIESIENLPEDQRSKSNGPLMRASPLALLGVEALDEEIFLDTEITNITSVNGECTAIYVRCLQLALRGYTSEEIWNDLIHELGRNGFEDEVAEVITDVDQNVKRDIATNKGLCTHALWCALYAMKYKIDKGFPAIMKWVISKKGSDTDTNAAITGALIGAIIGFQNLDEEENIEILLNVDKGSTPRPEEYNPNQGNSEEGFFKLMRRATRLWKKHNPEDEVIIIKKKVVK